MIIDTYEQVVCSAAIIHRHKLVALGRDRAIARPHYEQRGIAICSGQRETLVTAKSAQRTSSQEGFVGLICPVGPSGARRTCRADQTDQSLNSRITLKPLRARRSRRPGNALRSLRSRCSLWPSRTRRTCGTRQARGSLRSRRSLWPSRTSRTCSTRQALGTLRSRGSLWSRWTSQTG